MKKTYLVIDFSVIADSGEGEKISWKPSLFSSLSQVAAYGIYTPVIRAGRDTDEKLLAYCIEVLSGEKVFVENVIYDLSEISGANEETSRYLTSGEAEGPFPVIPFTTWQQVLPLLIPSASLPQRTASVKRSTKETSISVEVNLDGTGKAEVSTKIPFFDHMLDQIARHGRIDLNVFCDGDVEIDEHHSVEDTAICLGEAILTALGDKRGIGRYGDARVPMDDVNGSCILDFSNRPYLLFDVSFARDMVGTFPTEMVEHFFKSFSDESRSNIHLSVTQGNTHHQVEALFKAFARSLKQAVFRYPGNTDLPSTKGML